MPKQNRPLVRDGRLQTPKKRTDRSYLRPGGPDVAEEPTVDQVELAADDSMVTEVADAMEEAAASGPLGAFSPPANPAPTAPVAQAAAAPRTAAAPSRLPTAVRAIQQQGVRKRRDVDLGALAARDTNYALHELRRIGILTVLVIVALVVLTLVLR